MFRRKKEEEKSPAQPPVQPPVQPEPRVSVAELVNRYLDENKGEVSLAWFARQEKFPYIPPLLAVKEYVEAKGGSVSDMEELRRTYMRILESKMASMGSAL
ncbi:hypothetical protein D9Q81_00290 [Candidatus Korarchaeum cryptofilum]|uniref:Uncharacterized protein n=2 Tax=Candidatus Korarchaeum cryptofilum TaxID=498846 RepID=B1L5B1_KORCO|nr:hypothetical protein [Candidatus Korarchaeum cryptofilum]ACB07640.1 hypothetical protein Kcr_0894 [Candidatus Korarchaeum cryptofilum OPF8]RSN70881.1 hypothetical protein D9Q81_00290 [Candidatus Korarchaeum cryptofilum]